jgi:hypothetical protein
MVGLLPVPAVFCCFGQQGEEAAARAEGEQLRGQIARLLERLAGAEEQLSRPRRARTGSRGQRIAVDWLGAASESRAWT